MPARLASIDVAELPLGAVQILGDQLLRRPLLAVVQRGEAVLGGTARHGEAAVGAGVGGGERLAEHVRHPREALLDGLAVLAAAPVLSGLAHPPDHLLVLGEQRELRVHLVCGRVRMERDVEDAAEDVGRHGGGCVRGRGRVAEVVEVALREVDDDAALARHGRDGPRAGVPQLEAHRAGPRQRRGREGGARLAVAGLGLRLGVGVGLGLRLGGAVAAAAAPGKQLLRRRLLLVLLHRVEVDPRHPR